MNAMFSFVKTLSIRIALACLSTTLLSSLALADNSVIRLATTTSTENSGLLAELLPQFERESGIRVHVIAVGTGKALRLAREGDVDVVLVHARAAEDQLIADGFGVERRDVMHNDFMIVGPSADSAGVRNQKDVTAALKKIAAAKQIFVSRGDESGTHKKEMQLWRGAGVYPAAHWYRSTGQGMGKVLQIAAELQAYTLTDRGTWLAYKNKVPLEIMFQGDARLYNPYGIIAVNPKKYPDINFKGAMQLINWITSPPTQQAIHDFKIEGNSLFFPRAMKHAQQRDVLSPD